MTTNNDSVTDGGVRGVSTRRGALGAVAAMLAAGAWPGARATAAQAPGGGISPIRFVVANDMHHEDAGCDGWMAALFREIAGTEGAVACFGLGDLANSGSLESLRAMKRLSQLAGMPFLPCPGNHDLDESPVSGHYESVFPGRRNYVWKHAGWQFVVLDSTEGAKFQGVEISKDTLEWLDKTLPELDPAAPLVLATHFPLAAEVRMCPVNADAVLARFIGHNLRGVFGGHFHGRTVSPRGSIQLRTCACVARVRDNHDKTPEKGYLVVDGNAAGDLRVEFVRFGGV